MPAMILSLTRCGCENFRTAPLSAAKSLLELFFPTPVWVSKPDLIRA
ncbi:hypothetical protein [Mesorhizobium sp. J8]|nr:hypothetical protein [Mesorhizobium sp. J8]